MSLTVNAKTFTGDSYSANAVVYVGPAHTLTVKDDLRVSRVLPKPTSVFSGVARQSFKLTRTHTLTCALSTVADSISEMSFSVPVGTAGADVDTICLTLARSLHRARSRQW
jgi:hypothetical protein